MAAQRRADRGGRDLHAESEQLALDALVAPAGVLRGEANDQLLHAVVQRRPPGSTMRVGPRTGDQPPMPAQQRLRGDEEARPAGSWQHAADRGEQGTVGWFQLGSRNLAAEHDELVAQHQDLQILGSIAADEQAQELDGAAQGQVGESGQHAGWPPQRC